MIPGLNSNIKRNEKIYHIQTEDSGPKYGHVISHLFLDGTILASVKTKYNEHLELEPDKLEKKVIAIMRRSHRKMVHQLTSGEFDEQQEPQPEVVVQADDESLEENGDNGDNGDIGELLEEFDELVDDKAGTAQRLVEKGDLLAEAYDAYERERAQSPNADNSLKSEDASDSSASSGQKEGGQQSDEETSAKHEVSPDWTAQTVADLINERMQPPPQSQSAREIIQQLLQGKRG